MARRDRMWVITPFTLTLGAANVSTASQAVGLMGTSFESQADRALRGVTLSTMYVKGFWAEATVAASPIAFGVQMGVIVANLGLDAGDYPDLSTGDGDYLLRDCREVREASASATDLILEPSRAGDNIGGPVNIHNRSQRRISRVGEGVSLVVQKDAATEFNITLNVYVTALYLLP